MREIKFRGLSTEANHWVYGFYCRIQEDNSEYTHVIKEDTTRHISNVKATSYQVSGKSVGEYTGLKDKNGIEIYEGDFVLIDKTIHAVRFKNCYFECYPMKSYANTLSRFHDESKVIGNIYENPELLTH